jgi:hypothetical protein
MNSYLIAGILLLLTWAFLGIFLPALAAVALVCQWFGVLCTIIGVVIVVVSGGFHR